MLSAFCVWPLPSSGPCPQRLWSAGRSRGHRRLRFGAAQKRGGSAVAHVSFATINPAHPKFSCPCSRCQTVFAAACMVTLSRGGILLNSRACALGCPFGQQRVHRHLIYAFCILLSRWRRANVTPVRLCILVTWWCASALPNHFP